MTEPAPRSEVGAAVGLDVVAVLVFVALGRRTHDEGSALGGILAVSAPFLIALGVGWVVLRAWRQPLAAVTGVGLWLITVTGGMLLRGTVFDRGTAPAFVIVATVVVGVFLVGWRALARRWRSGRVPGGAADRA